MSRMTRGNLRFLALEGLIVVFGVLAALFVDEWREDRALDRQAAAAQERLLEEVAQNLRELESMERVVKERQDSLIALDAALDGTVSLRALTDRFGGYRQPDLAEGAWVHFSTSELADRAPGDLVRDAFALYAQYRYFRTLDDQVARLVFSELNVDPRRGRHAWHVARGIMEQQLAWALQSIPAHRAFLEKWGDGAPIRTPPPSTDSTAAADSTPAADRAP